MALYPATKQPGSGITATLEQNRWAPQAGEFHYLRSSFIGAGVDNYTKPPSQNPEAFMQLANIQPAQRGVLERRWGYGQMVNTMPIATRHLVLYQNDVLNTRRIVAISQGEIDIVDEAGAPIVTGLYVPAATVGPPNYTVPEVTRMANSRSTGYFTNGVDYKKWREDLTPAPANWGISPLSLPTDTFPGTFPVSGVDLDGGFVAWSNPNNIIADDANVATAALTLVNPKSNLLQALNFSAWAIPAAAKIVGIEVFVRAAVSLPAGAGIVLTCKLVRNMFTHPSALVKTATVPGSGAYSTITFGSATDPWDGTWTSYDLNSALFSVYLQATSSAAYGRTININYVSMIVTYVVPITVGAPAPGAITLVSGRTYFVVGQNSQTGHLSDLNLPSATTGAITNKEIALSNISVSTDPQVDQKLLLATSDGNDYSTLYYLTMLDNSETTFTDNVPETELLTRNIYQQTDANGNPHGVADNSPPPVGATKPIKHRGRLFMLQGQVLWFSKSFEELTTATGTICGVYEESWPGTYQLDISEGAETGRGLLSDGTALYVGTERNIRRLLGDGPADFTSLELIHNEVGLLNQEVWQVVFKEGTPVGTIWLTPDFRIILSDFSTYQDIGTPVQNTLNNINAVVAQDVASASFLTTQAYDLFKLSIPTGSNTECDTELVFDLRTHRWVEWQPQDKVTAQLFNINASGVPQILFTAPGTALYRYGPEFSQDREDTALPVQIPVCVQTSWLDLGDDTLRKMLNELEVISGDVGTLSVMVEGASTATDFQFPVVLAHARPVRQDPFGVWKVFLAGEPAHHRYFRLTFTSSGPVTNVLEGFNLVGLPWHRF